VVEVMRTYKVRASLDTKYWFVEVPEINHATQGRTLAEVPLMARELISLMTGRPMDEVAVDVEWVLPESVTEHLQRVEKLRHQSAEANTAAARESRAAARELRNAGLGLKDIGALLGVSYQRAHQLVSGPTATASAEKKATNVRAASAAKATGTVAALRGVP
jgi:predicted RNase H-like HicB family nuclease